MGEPFTAKHRQNGNRNERRKPDGKSSTGTVAGKAENKTCKENNQNAFRERLHGMRRERLCEKMECGSHGRLLSPFQQLP